MVRSQHFVLRERPTLVHSIGPLPWRGIRGSGRGGRRQVCPPGGLDRPGLPPPHPPRFFWPARLRLQRMDLQTIVLHVRNHQCFRRGTHPSRARTLGALYRPRWNQFRIPSDLRMVPPPSRHQSQRLRRRTQIPHLVSSQWRHIRTARASCTPSAACITARRTATPFSRGPPGLPPGGISSNMRGTAWPNPSQNAHSSCQPSPASAARPLGIGVPNSVAAKANVPMSPPPRPPSSYRTASSKKPPGAKAKSSGNFAVDIEDDLDMSALGAVGETSARPPAPLDYLPSPPLSKADTSIALRKILNNRSRTNILATIRNPAKRPANPRDFFRILLHPSWDRYAPPVESCVMWNLGFACAMSNRRQLPDKGENPAAAMCHHMRVRRCCKCDGDHPAVICPMARAPDIPSAYAWLDIPPTGWGESRNQKLAYWRSHIYAEGIWRGFDQGENPRPPPACLFVNPDRPLSDIEPAGGASDASSHSPLKAHNQTAKSRAHTQHRQPPTRWRSKPTSRFHQQVENSGSPAQGPPVPRQHGLPCPRGLDPSRYDDQEPFRLH
jgi:hypothetical protein